MTIVNSHLLFFDKHNILHLYGKSAFEEIFSKQFDSIYNIECIDNELYIFLNDSILLMDKLTLETSKGWKARFGRATMLSKNYVYEQQFERKNQKLKIALFNRTTGEELWNIDIPKLRFVRDFDGKLIVTDIEFRYFFNLDLTTGLKAWEITLPDNEKVIGDIYVHDGILVFACMEGEIIDDKNYLYGLDLNHGNILWKREGAFYYYQKDADKGYLYGFAHGSYEVTNPVTGQRLVERKLSDDLWVSQHMNFLGTDGLYFVGGNHTNMGMFISKFGKINLETHQIEFVQNLDVPEGVKADAPICHEGKLFIKDSRDVLHIYQNR